MSVRTCATVSSNDVTAAPFGLTICAIVKIVHFVSRTFVGVVIGTPRRRVRSHRDRESPKALGRAGASRAQRRASIDERRARDGANGCNHRPARHRPHAPSGSSSQKLASRKGGSRSRRGRDFNRDGPNVRWFTNGRGRGGPAKGTETRDATAKRGEMTNQKWIRRVSNVFIPASV